MRGVFAAFATVRFRPDAVHRNVQGFMRLWPQRTQRHARCHEPFADRGDGFHLFNRHGFAQHFDIQQIADVNGRVGPHGCRILLPQIERRAVAGLLQHVHGLGFPCVLFTRTPGFVEAADGQNIGPTAPAFGVNLFGLDLDTRQTDARNTALHAGEIFGHHGAA